MASGNNYTCADGSLAGNLKGVLAPLIFCALFFTSTYVRAGEALVAVAANFSDASKRIKNEFENGHNHKVKLVTGSTGKLYAQIINGAPFDVFLAADTVRPEKLEADGRAVAGSRFTYALGQLVLWSAQKDLIGDDGAQALEMGRFRRLAMANPDLAPYGAAAIQTLQNLNLHQPLKNKIVMGENAGQAFALVSSGNAELGFVPLTFVMNPVGTAKGQKWIVPADKYDPIRQDAVLLMRAKENEAATRFLTFLRSDDAKSVIKDLGYGVQ
ncbi:MAG: molybdate ABC transporter substrate-binding protein [Hyphomicrobiales bacterium]